MVDRQEELPSCRATLYEPKTHSCRDRMPIDRPQEVTLLHADVENYTGRMAQNPLATVRAVRWCRALFTKIINTFGGRVVNRVADNIIAIFPQSSTALQASVEIQSRLAEPFGSNSKIAPLTYRIGLDIGYVRITGNDLFGDAVNRAARIQEAAEPGGILASDAVCRQAENLELITMIDEGVHQLRGLTKTVRCFKIESTLRPISLSGRRRPLPRLIAPKIPSLVVLPIRDMAGNQEARYLADGLTEDLITSLSRFRQLFVISRTTSFAYRNRPAHPKVIGRELGVRYVVEGSLRYSESNIRLTCSIVDASNGQVIWGEILARPKSNLFELQDEVVIRLVTSLIGEVSRHALRIALTKGTESLEAYDFILRGEEEMFRYSAQANASARSAYEMAAHLDPMSSRAHSLLSRTHNHDWRYRWSPDPDLSSKMSVMLAQRAIELDPLDSRGYAELGWALLYRRELAECLRAYERSHELNPNDGDTLALWADAICYCGDPLRALAMVDRAKRLNPHYPDIYLWSEADALFALRRYRDVITCIGQMRDPAEGSRLLAASYAHLGEFDQAQRFAAIVLRRQPGFRVEDWISVQPEADPAELEHFRQGLYLAGLP